MNYPYANGTIAAIDNNVLDPNKLSKLFRKEKSEFLKILYDMGYGTNSTDNLEEIINFEMIKTKHLIDDISPDRTLTDLFFLANDALNIKALFKIRIFGISCSDVFSDSGIVDPEVLKKAILEDNMAGLSKALKALLIEINKKVLDLKNPRVISAIIDNSIFEYLFESLKHHPSDALETYFKAYIDFANVMTFIRSKNLKWKNGQFTEMFIGGGLMPKSMFDAVYDLPDEAILRNFSEYYEGRITSGLKHYFEQKDLTMLERHFDQLILKIMKAYRYDSFNIGPIVYYFLKKQAEAKNIRLLFADKALDASELLDY